MTAKTAPKVTLWEFFQQLGKPSCYPWHYCRSAALCSALVVLLAAMMS
ncbi:PTS system maltose and glucose-specific transporter subunit IICB [Escherichia coli]|uniref:PTS system maltose and glucose-specific transporter subunit IICB n=1 Tax=Escherichia coli TaxID=562 RepID=A0A376ZZJ7_ECOLX|nr:PTS system maltose and glucose-specific transporter subunit IICB [Escherichia coli]